ncbi:MAG TPA: Crp/Fnr family transcriptional regulator [Pyrinomonadaceae bacterium]|nr:Crp/Fnr family transcriptional regulator [Pyrinomonadaceae bacterium]
MSLMGDSTTISVPLENKLLAALSKKEYERLLTQMEYVPLNYTEVLYQPNERIQHVYFPNSGLIALTSPVNKSSTTAVNMIGSSGMLGIGVFLGDPVSPTPAIVLVAGTALKMKAAVLQKESRRGSLQRLLLDFTHSQLTLAYQAAICNHYHQIHERLCCWLLYIHDAAGSTEFPMTHNLLANMMGVRREEVSKAASALQDDKVISYRPGHVTILNLAELKKVTCECYRIVKGMK